MNIAIVSTAHIHTRSFIENILNSTDGRKVYGIWDDVEERGKRYAESAATRFVSDLDALVQDSKVDGFIICAENTRHLPLLERVLPAGKPVFCEKPLVTNGADLARIQALLKIQPAPLFCGYFTPFSGEMRAVADLVRGKAFGQITRVRMRMAHHAAYGRWFNNPDLQWFADPVLAGGGAFMDMGTHAVHLLRSLFGPVAETWASIANESGVYPDVDDSGVAHLLFESGIRGTVEAAWTQTGGVGGLEICGSEKALWHNGREYVTGIPAGEPEPLAPAPALPDRVDRLAACIRCEISAEELEADLAAIMDTVLIMEAAYRSSQSGTWIRNSVTQGGQC